MEDVCIGEYVIGSYMSLLVEEYIRSLHMILESGKINSDLYNDALSIQLQIERLYRGGMLSDKELKIIVYTSYGYSFAEVGDLVGLDRKTVNRIFKNSCNSIGFLLGGKFTDIGFAHDIASKRMLGDSGLRKLNKFLKRKGEGEQETM